MATYEDVDAIDNWIEQLGRTLTPDVSALYRAETLERIERLKRDRRTAMEAIAAETCFKAGV